MADFDHSDFGGAYDAPVRSTFSTVLNWIGAALSLGLIAGLGYWAYQLVVRDVTGVPVVRALEGPMRIAPEDPGGSTAAFQGLAVNAIAAEGTAEAPADLVVLAPVEVNLTEEDRAMAALLIEKGAGLSTKDMQGRTPLSVARKEGKRAIAKLLEEHGARE